VRSEWEMGKMRSIVILPVIVLLCGIALAQQPPGANPKTLVQLLSEGYEIKSFAMGATVLQKGTSAFICEVNEKQPSTGQKWGASRCFPATGG
jgi:hypothetical protein